MCVSDWFNYNVCQGRRYTPLEKSRAGFAQKLVLIFFNTALIVAVMSMGSLIRDPTKHVNYSEMED